MDFLPVHNYKLGFIVENGRITFNSGKGRPATAPEQILQDEVNRLKRKLGGFDVQSTTTANPRSQDVERTATENGGGSSGVG